MLYDYNSLNMEFKMADLLQTEEIDDFLQNHPAWSYADNTLKADYELPNFRKAFAAVSELALQCEKQNHHPDIKWSYNSLSFALTTHDAGNQITHADIKLAKEIDKICSS